MKVTGTPEVTVIITAHSRREFLKGAVESVLKQTLDRNAYEIIVIKNFVDHDLDLFLDQSGVRVLDCNVRLGMALSLGIQLARGEVVSFLDDDDYFLPEKLSLVRAAFTENPRLGYFHNSFAVIRGSSISVPQITTHKSGSKLLTFDPILLPDPPQLLRAPSLGFNLSSVSIRREWVKALLPKLEEIEAAPDGFFILSALGLGIPAVIHPQVLTLYRFHASTSHFLERDPEVHARREAAHMRKFVAALTVLQGLLKGTPMDEQLRYDLIYWRIRHALFDSNTSWKPKLADVAFFISGGIKRRALYPFYLLPAHLASRISPRLVRAAFRMWAMHFGERGIA